MTFCQNTPAHTETATLTRTESALQKLEAALTPSNPRVKLVASRLETGKGRWKSTTLVRKMQAAELSSLEQFLYIELSDPPILPRSFKQVLTVLLEGTPLTIHDFKQKPANSEHLIVDRKLKIVTRLDNVIELVQRIKDEFGHQPLSMINASKIVLIYDEDAAMVIESIAYELCELQEMLGIDCDSQAEAFSRVCNFLVNHVFQYCNTHCKPYPISLKGFLEEHDSDFLEALREIHGQ